MTETRAFVAGATGYVGREVVARLAARGATVTAHIRPDSPSLSAMQERFRAEGASADTTAWTPSALSNTLERLKPTHVFALLGITRARAKARAREGLPAESYASVDHGLTAMLLEATRHAASPAHFIYLSAIGARETAGNEYTRIRGRLERAIRDSGLTALIVRASFITGRDREEPRPLERMASGVVNSILAGAALLGASRVRDRYRSMTGGQLAQAMISLALEPPSGVRFVDGEDLWAALRRRSPPSA